MLNWILELLGIKKRRPKLTLVKPLPEPVEVKEEPKPIVEEKTGMLHAKNNSARIKKELVRLKEKNPELHALIIDLYLWIGKEFGKDTVLTMIYRTQEEQDYLYRHSAKYKEKPFKSPHQFWHALDLRTSIYTDEEIEKIVKYLNDKYDNKNYYGWTAKAHAIKGNAMHFHIQFVKK